MIHVTHIITDMEFGGAETVLYRLVKGMRSDPQIRQQVISMVSIGTIGRKVEALGIPIRTLHMTPTVPNPLSLLQLIRWLRADPPDVIQTWMYHADLIGGLAAKAAGGMPVAWGIRHSTLDPEGTKRMTHLTAHLSARWSRWLPTRIVSCSEVSKRVHLELGYDGERMLVIPNGFDLNQLKPDADARSSFRKELNLPPETLLIGLMARFDPQKDQETFIKAAAMLHEQLPEVHFVLCGTEIEESNSTLMGWIEAANLQEHVHLMGVRSDVPRVTAAFDIATSSSAFGEAFPNVLAEAMACGVPCVATDVGDAAIIIGETGIVVPTKDPEALSRGWYSLLGETSTEKRLELGLRARRRIENRYQQSSTVNQYKSLYQSMVLNPKPIHPASSIG
ncbi:MAG: glycosyltransferase [Chloroflexota bacterium]